MSEVSSSSQKRHVLVLGAGLAGLAAVRELRRDFYVTVVDAKEYFEFTSGILRAYVKPEHWETLVFPYQEVLEDRLKVTFKCGEVVALHSDLHCAEVRMIWGEELEEIEFHFCLIAAGCNFNQLSRFGISPWFPVIHERARDGKWDLDERFLESRRRSILREHQQLVDLHARKASILVVGAGYQAVQWACELNYFFPSLRVFLVDFMPRCLGPLPEDAAAYCEEYMRKHGISTQYNVKYDENSEAFWHRVGLPDRADKIYVLSGAKHSNYFVDEVAQSQRGPGGGGWILINKFLQVVTKTGERWGEGAIFAVGDCASSSGEASKWELPQLPKTGFPAEQQAIQASKNIKALDRRWFAKRCCLGGLPMQHLCGPRYLRPTWFPWAAGIFAISLGPDDGVLIVGAKYEKGSGRVYCRGAIAAAIKDLVEVTKVASSKHEHWLSCTLWYCLHQWSSICS